MSLPSFKGSGRSPIAIHDQLGHTIAGDRLPLRFSLLDGDGAPPSVLSYNSAIAILKEPATAEQESMTVPMKEYKRREGRLELDPTINSDIRDILAGVERFKQYNIHEQIDDDPVTDAIGLGPGEYRVPNKDRFPYPFPHDAYYMAKGDRNTEYGRKLVETFLDKQVQLYKRFKIMPNFGAYGSLNTGSPEFFIPMAMEWYDSHPGKETDEIKDKLKIYMEVGADEHDTVWNNPRDLTGAIGSYHHMVPGYKYLRRVGDRDAGYATNAGREWVWDFSSVRGAGSEDALLPICVNTILASNKETFGRAAEILGMETLGGRTPQEWRSESAEMKQEINTFLYNPETKNYHDRDYKDNILREESTLAAVWALWGEVASGEQAMDVIRNLERLDHGHGLVVTAPEDFAPEIPDEAFLKLGIPKRYIKAIQRQLDPANWDGNVWPPPLITMKEGILKYVRSTDKGLSPADKLVMTRFAIRQTENEIKTQMNIRNTTNGKFSEKWKADGTDDNGHFHYEPQQNGLGWSATLAELNVTQFLPELYSLEDELEMLIAAEQQPVSVPIFESVSA